MNSSMWKKWHPLTFTGTCWQFMKNKQWTSAQWGGGAFQQWQQWQWATSTGADFYTHGMQALVHCWWKCIANGGDYTEKQLFCSWGFALSNTIVVLFVSITVVMEINRRHYFLSDLHMFWRNWVHEKMLVWLTGELMCCFHTIFSK